MITSIFAKSFFNRISNSQHTLLLTQEEMIHKASTNKKSKSFFFILKQGIQYSINPKNL